jgi:hypothetical protein
VEPYERDKWKLSKDYSWAPELWKSDKDSIDYDYMAEIYKQIMDHREKVKKSISSSKPTANPSPFKNKAKIKVDVSHMSKDVGADILQRVKQTYEDHND